MRCLRIAAVLTVVATSLLVQAQESAAQPRPQELAANTRVVIDYIDPRFARSQATLDRLRKRQVLEELAMFLSPLRLPRVLRIRTKSCGVVNAFYDRSEWAVSLCYEFYEHLEQIAPQTASPQGYTRDEVVVGGFIDAIFHELGHALFDILQVPVFGREEDAADFFSAYVLLRFAPEDAARLFQGVGFMMASEAKAALEKPQDLRAFAVPHGTAAQRYYNLLCMAYGSDPKTFADAVSKGGLPTERADGCAEEFATLERAFRKLIVPYIDEELLAKARAEVRFNWGPLITSTSGLDALPLAE